LVASVMYAVATPRFPAKAPDAIRATNSVVRELARPSISNAPVLPAMVKSSTGRRPMRSDSRPHSGPAMNCISAKLATSSPSSTPPAPNSST
jgi:hypothetical protein